MSHELTCSPYYVVLLPNRGIDASDRPVSGREFNGETLARESPHAHSPYFPHCVAMPSRARTPRSKRSLITSMGPSPKTSAS